MVDPQPVPIINYISIIATRRKSFFFLRIFGHTKNTASLAAIVIISEQETTPGHCFSSCFLAASITSYPRKLRFAGESFSAVLSFVESTRIDPSHPYSAKTTKYYYYNPKDSIVILKSGRIRERREVNESFFIRIMFSISKRKKEIKTKKEKSNRLAKWLI